MNEQHDWKWQYAPKSGRNHLTHHSHGDWRRSACGMVQKGYEPEEPCDRCRLCERTAKRLQIP